MKSRQKLILALLSIAFLVVWGAILGLAVSDSGINLESLIPPTHTPRPSPTPIACTDANKRAFASEAIKLVYEQDADLDRLNYADISSFPEDDPLGGFVGRANNRKRDLASIPYPHCISSQRDALLYVFEEFHQGVSALRNGNVSTFESHFRTIVSRVDPAVDAILLMLP